MMEQVDRIDPKMFNLEKLKAIGLSDEKASQAMDEINLRIAMQEYLFGLAEKMERGEISEVNGDEVYAALNQIATDKFGHEYGLPVPSLHDINRRMVLAKGTPLSRLRLSYRTEFEEELVTRKFSIRNSWSVLGDQEICVVDTEEGPMALPRYHAGWRLQKLLDTALMREGTQQTAEAEMRAVESLKGRIGGRQFDSYMLSGVFPEKSKRSDIHYFFRKGLPTLAISYHSGFEGDYSSGKVLACLCLHPFGYYQGTYCGLMTPTDEVICALLMMRGDEHGYWKSCGQWAASDPRSGI